MGKYTRTFTVTREFDGDTVIVELSRLQRKHMAQMSGNVEMKQDGTYVMKGTQEEILDKISGTVRECVVRLDGLTDNEGAPVPIEVVLDDTYFFELSMWLLTSLMKGSRMADDGDDAKKSAAPSSGTSGAAA